MMSSLVIPFVTSRRVQVPVPMWPSTETVEEPLRSDHQNFIVRSQKLSGEEIKFSKMKDKP
jgi:hypothetical protein